MIRLTLNAYSEPEIHLFNKAVILIGTEAGRVDLTLPEQNIQPVHLKIIKQDEFPILINCSNDPFASVNGLPFGKKLLNSGDIITLNQTTILFENLDSLQMSTQEQENEISNHQIPSSQGNHAAAQQIESHQLPHLSSTDCSPSFSFPLAFERDVKAFEENEASLDELLKGIELDISSARIDSPQDSSEKIKTDKKNQASLRDDYLKDLEDDHQAVEKSTYGGEKEPSHLYQAWKWILLFIFSLLAITVAAGTIIYYSLSDKTEAHETKAAQGMADITIALVNAQLKGHVPHNQNWTDVEFLKSNLQAMLPNNHSYASQIDSQGQFNCCSYSLRIYTSGDLSHFLLIAQPAPNLLNWLIPQSLIVVDSHLMELRILKDVRSLNRLLANPNPLDGINGKEITALVKQGILIRLSSLASESTHLDFAPPKNLAWLRPGSENLIYNAPRYFRLGHQILEKSIALSSSKGTSQEVMTLKQEIENISRLNHLVIYSSRGKKSALQARQGIRNIVPTSEIIFGYLLFNAEGKIHRVHLIKEEEESPVTSFINVPKENVPKEEDLITLEEMSTVEMEDKIPGKPIVNEAIDTNHPIFIQLKTLAIARENELKPLVATLAELIHQDLQSPGLQLRKEFGKLAKTYLVARDRQNEIIKQNIDSLHREYENMPNDQFISFLKALNLEGLIEKENESTLSTHLLNDHVNEREMQTMAAIKNKHALNGLSYTDDCRKADYHIMWRYQNHLQNKFPENLQNYLLIYKKCSFSNQRDKVYFFPIVNDERLIQKNAETQRRNGDPTLR